jgi:hypothetical protein
VANVVLPLRGLSMESTDPAALLKRAERLLWIAETIAAQAQENDDSRLALQAVDRARASMETMMRATGVIGGDTQVNVLVNAQQREQMTAREAIAVLVRGIEGERRQTEAVRYMVAFLGGVDVPPLQENRLAP